MAWGSDGRGGDDGYSLEESHTQAVVAALVGGPYLLADELATLLPEERAVLEDPDVLDLAWDERGFRPLDLFDHVDDGRQHAYAQPDDLPSVWVAERGGSAASWRCSTGPTPTRTGPRTRRHDGHDPRPRGPDHPSGSGSGSVESRIQNRRIRQLLSFRGALYAL